MFRGTFEHTIDEKGRVSVPVKFREVLQKHTDPRIVITNFKRGMARCLDVYPFTEWEKLEEQLADRTQFDTPMQDFVDYYLAAAQVCELDKPGRILLPPNLRDYALLKKEAVFTSALKKFRIWDAAQWQIVFEAAERAIAERPQSLADLRI
jgi:MraZ protein